MKRKSEVDLLRAWSATCMHLERLVRRENRNSSIENHNFCWPCWADVRLCKHTTGKNSTNFGYRHHNLNHANLSRNKNRSTLLDDNDNDNANESSIHSPRLNNLGNSFTICLLFIGRASFSCICIGNFNVIWSMIDKIWIYFYFIALKLSR